MTRTALENFLTFSERQLQRKFGHASDLGVTLNNNAKGRAAFRAAILAHVVDADTTSYNDFWPGQGPNGTRGPVISFWNPVTGISAIFKLDGSFVSTWLQNEIQAACFANCTVWALTD